MRSRSLRRVLTRQWIGFSLTLAAGFIGLSLLLLFMLEDHFIDGRLQDVATNLGTRPSTAPLPDRYRLYADEHLPAELRARMTGARPGVVREFRLRDGRYVHAMWTLGPGGQPQALIYDASDDLTVNQGISHGWPYALALLALLALAAQLLARRLIGRITRQAGTLIRQLHDAADPTSLRHYAERETIHEFAELARLSADAWEARLAALERERSTLAFLAHELRTPLQSAKVSLALLEDDLHHDQAMIRLRRAVDRLVRASNSLLWLAGDISTTAIEPVRIDALLRTLIAEIEPLAASRQQTFMLHVAHACEWPLRSDAAETLFANLLLNAVQHGDAGVVHVEVDANGVRIDNPCRQTAADGGFGMGLQIVARLAERLSLQLHREWTEHGLHRVQVACGASPSAGSGSPDVVPDPAARAPLPPTRHA